MAAKNTADRIKAALKDKVGPEEKEDFSCPQQQPYNCIRIKIPRLPKALMRLFEKLEKKISSRKATLVSSEWNKEVKQTHLQGLHADAFSSRFPEADLIPTRVKRWYVKEYHSIVQKMRALSVSKESSEQHEITLLYEDKSTVQEQKSPPEVLWEEMIKAKEERQFQIGRITKYFS